MRGQECEKNKPHLQVPKEKKCLTKAKIRDIITTKDEGKENPTNQKGIIVMKKNTMNTILSLIATIDTPEAQEVREELTAELAKGKAKADANRAIYDEIHDAVIEVLKNATDPVTAQELADETGYAKGKIVYGLRNYWADEVEKTEGKVNSYALKG
jgi:response regulator of citrate/malate metabolism